ncbi:Uncharacterized protein OS=Singulisphaera acidiphila (strain ATCC BAA-1392 / DSM 18658 / VKM B-2454 / MOB10) GN=Sinac_6171 PE=4 SV=1 [Gemmata massiliana]|uniref:Uncharacterized protein n=1 Tax=Gemmata massiliana TaxID=1210884 RepID=A0A6P2D4G3_9BACT|nr:hypothetical protein [Gemmata massiliana]VTR95376.1 Uncharacterized protein OS=Singulisphaera acidiphila (strain ATCC BAA-1392 / DSM 18658 / VKM B-2454 / MOB10) GN=Sinac_6171 PE=4 SV=1 [Gemmata massiliana]
MTGAGWRRTALCVFALACGGCSIGPRALPSDRIRYNEAVKVSGEEQLLLNIVRLRYIDTPSSLAVSSLADQYEFTRNVGLTPFFTAAAAGQALGGYRSTVLPQVGWSSASRPTLTYTSQDDQEFTRRLFTPLSLESTASLSKTTWPTSTVFRLWLENMNWVSNAETASGPTPKTPPEFADFLAGVEALQRLTDRKLATIFIDEQDDPVSDELPPEKVTASAQVRAAQAGFEYRKDKNGNWRVVRKKQQPTLRFDESVKSDSDFLTLCRLFKLNPALTSFEFTTAKLDPYLKGTPKDGLDKLDLETRSLLQVLFFVANGVEVPTAHLANGIAPVTVGPDGRQFDWQQVLGGLFKVCWAEGKKPPASAHVAVQHKGYWFYIDERDRDTKATFALLVELARLQLSTDKGGSAPLLTLPIGGR